MFIQMVHAALETWRLFGDSLRICLMGAVIKCTYLVDWELSDYIAHSSPSFHCR